MTKFPKVFEGIGKLKDFELKIKVDKNVEPVVQQTRRVPYHLREKLEQKLKQLQELDIIEKVDSSSEWVSPVVIVPRANGDIRLCVDMREANKAVVRERYPIPTVGEVLQDLNHSKVFSKLDIKWAYHQIEIEPESREITTFMTHKGLFRYKRLMFGISCAPEMYNKIMHQALEGCEGVRSIFDDIVVHGSSQEQHDERLDGVMKRLHEKGLTVNVDKCNFNMDHIEFMGHILSEHGIGLADAKVQAVQNAREPASASEVRSFLGLVNFSARFIPNLATISEPLRKLTKKNEPFVWSESQQSAFDELKRQLSSAKTLGYYDIKAKTIVIADASPVGLGAVLVQEQGGETRVITYASRSLSDVERRYSQTEKEALGLVWACERFHMYLFGTEFELLTDHKPLQFIFSPRSKPSARIERWILRLQSYSYTVRHIPGSTNIADCLSRLLSKSNSTEKGKGRSDEYVYLVAREATPVAMTTREIERASDTDTQLTDIRTCLLTGKWYQLQSKAYLPVKHELCAIGKLVLRGTRIVTPRALRDRVLDLAHEGHPGIVVMKQRLREKVWWPGMDQDVEQVCKTCYGCQLVSKPMNPEPMTRTEIPSGPWQHLAADFLGPLPSGDNLFVLVDYYSRWVEVTVTRSTSTDKVIDSLTKTFATHGLPVSITTDNGPQFVSEIFRLFMDENNIEHRRVTPLWPQANGEVERQNRSILKRIRIPQAAHRDWKKDLQTYLLMYRSTPHCTTGVSPAELLFRRKIRTKLPEITQHVLGDTEVRDRDSEKKEKGKIYSDKKRNAVTSDLKSGDSVLVKQDHRNKLSTTFNPEPMKVVNKCGNSVVVESGEGIRYKRNVTKLRKFYQKCASNGSEPVNGCSNHKCLQSDVPDSGRQEIILDSEGTEADSGDSPVDDKITGIGSKSVDSDDSNGISTSPQSTPRPTRERRLPARFKDFVVT